MQQSMTADEIILTATLGELNTWQHTGLAVYATPAQDDHHYAVQVYVGSRPHFMYDFCVATVEDFLKEEGWDCLELAEEDATADDTIRCSVSRRKRVE